MTELEAETRESAGGPAYPIHDLYLRPVEEKESEGVLRWTVLSEDHHLLRRFGTAQVVRLTQDNEVGPQIREQADEVWAVLEGSAELTWEDLREGSPTRGNKHRQVITSPTAALVPFGVAFTARCLSPTVLLARLATHPDDAHPGDQTPN